MAKNKSIINLLPQEEFETSTFGRILKWAMSSFRIIVIVTEMIVMTAFLSRFWLDAQNANLSDSIKVANSQIEVQSDFEKEFRGLQTKLNIFKQVTTGVKASDMVNSIAADIPPDVTLSSITINNTNGEIKGGAASETSVAQLISNLKSNPAFKNVNLESISSSENAGSQISFQIDVSL